MVDIFTQYAQMALEVGEGFRSPPKPKVPLQRLIQESRAYTNIIPESIDHFLKDLLIPPDQMDEARIQFEKLYDAGILSLLLLQFQEIQEVITPTNSIKYNTPNKVIGIQLMVWDGTQYVDANSVLESDDEYYGDDNQEMIEDDYQDE